MNFMVKKENRLKILTMIKRFFREYGNKYYSHEGEDILLQKIFLGKKIFYIDVGACHPIEFSNTYCFYKNGSKGINIDANPVSVELLKKFRPRDINLNIAISSKEKQINLFTLGGVSGVESTDKSWVKKMTGATEDKIKSFTIETCSLSTIIERYCKDRVIDLLDVDVEGMDLDVLKSIDFDKVDIKVICIEINGKCLEDVLQSEIYTILKNQDYLILGKLLNAVIFIQKFYWLQTIS